MENPDTPLARQAPPWAAKRGLTALLDEWRSDASLARCFTLDQTIDAKLDRSGPIPEHLHPVVTGALEKRGLTSLYSHQLEALDHAAHQRHYVVATPTASGKSLCYNLPVLDRLAREPDARALYLFPTKALSRDQESALRGLLTDATLSHGAVTYDGDTPGDARRAARERSGILLTNPDMLHAGILPHHASWARFFAQLRFVVVDELHSYRGVFGSHLANVLRRLQRIARFHGSTPTFVFASATIGNPKEHAMRMLGEDVALVGESGAPAGPRHVLVYDPPVVNQELGIRASYVKSAVRLAADLVRHEVPTIVFGQSRNQIEVMLKYVRDRLAADKIDPELIQGYRSGYLPETRRRIEEGLRSGAVRCVVATNALELGIDIGSLSAVVCAGYPGSIASLWQRFGRAGRRTEPSLALMVASSMPLDQYIAQNASMLVGAAVEEARIDPDNVEILVSHLKCAAFELPFEEGEAFGDVAPEAVMDSLGYLARENVVHGGMGPNGKTVFHWATDAYPATHVSLRSLGWDNFVVVDLDSDRTIAEMDWRATHTMLHVQAIYQHDGEQYQVERLDFPNHKAFVRKVAPDYYTTALTYTRVSITHEDDGAVIAARVLATEGPDGSVRTHADGRDRRGEPIISVPGRIPIVAGHGEVSVIEKVVGYKKIKFHTHENVGYGDVRLPEMQMHTSAVWWTFAEDLIRSLGVQRAIVVDALRGLGNALHLCASVGLMCDPRDLGRTLGDRTGDGELPAKGDPHGGGFDPTIFLYDHVPGGVGLAPRLFATREEMLDRARVLIENCPCQSGCPACIGATVGTSGAPAGLVHDDAKLIAPPSFDLKSLALDVLRAAGLGPNS